MKCDWVGERSYGQEHYAKCHATVTPFWCKTCDYRAASERQIAVHQKQKKHVRKTKDNQEVIAYTPGVKMSMWLKELSAEESKVEWRHRGQTPTPESSSPSTLAISSVPDPDPAPPQTTAPVSQAEVAEATDILDKINQRIDSERQAIATLKKKQERQQDPPKPKRKGDDLEGKKATKQPRGSSPCHSVVSSLSVSSTASEGSMVVEAPVPVPTTHSPEPKEEDFVPDYDEGASRQSEAAKSDVKKLVQLAVKEVNHELLQSLVERPSVVATSVMAVTHQLIANNHLLTDVATRLKEAQPGPDTQMSVQLKHVLGDVHAELKQLNRGRVEVNRSSAALTSAVREMSSVLRSFMTTMQTAMTAMNAGVQAILGAKTPGSPPVSEFEFDIMKMAGEHDVDWTKMQNDKVRTHTQRCPDYPFFDTPGDRAKPSASECVRGHCGRESREHDRRSPRKALFTASRPVGQHQLSHQRYRDSVRRSVDRVLQRK